MTTHPILDPPWLQFHRTETWLFCTSPFPRLFIALTSYAIHESPTLWYSVRYQTQCLCLMLWTPFHHPSSTFAYPLENSHTFFCFSRRIPLSLNSGDTLYPIPSDSLGWLTWYRSDTLSFPTYPIRKYDGVPKEEWQLIVMHRCKEIETSTKQIDLFEKCNQGWEDSLEFCNQTFFPCPSSQISRQDFL